MLRSKNQEEEDRAEGAVEFVAVEMSIEDGKLRKISREEYEVALVHEQ